MCSGSALRFRQPEVVTVLEGQGLNWLLVEVYNLAGGGDGLQKCAPQSRRRFVKYADILHSSRFKDHGQDISFPLYYFIIPD